MHNLKKKVKNKVRVEGSIMEAYIIEEILNFNRYYFNLSVQIKLTQVSRNDDGGAKGSKQKIQYLPIPLENLGVRFVGFSSILNFNKQRYIFC